MPICAEAFAAAQARWEGAEVRRHAVRPMLWALILSLAILIGCRSNEPKITRYAVDIDSVTASYDWETAKSNLRMIGVALQQYRADCDVKPPSERKTYADAGLPPTQNDLTRLIPGSLSPITTRMNGPTRGGGIWAVSGGAVVFCVYALISKPIGPGLDPTTVPHILSVRGEELPIVVDDGMYTREELLSAVGRPLKVLVLRLNGNVEVARFTPFEWQQFFEKG